MRGPWLSSLAPILAAALCACGEAHVGGELGPAPALLSVDPAAGVLLGPRTPVELRFDMALARGGLRLSGTLGAVARAAPADPARPELLRLEPLRTWPDGAGDLQVEAAAEGSASAHVTLSFTVDARPPELDVVDPPGAVIRDPRVRVQIRFGEAVDHASARLSGSLAPEVRPTWPEDGALAFDPPADGWPEGGTLGIAVADLLGNVASSTLTVEVALVPGVPAIDVPIRAVRVTDDDGSLGAHITPQEVRTWVAEANRTYAVANVRFRYDPATPLETVRSSLLNRMGGSEDADWAAERAAADAVAAQSPGEATLLFRHGPGAAATGGGFSWSDLGFVALPGFQDTWVCRHQNRGLLAHELGHYLGLAHTFPAVYASVAEAEHAYHGDPDVFDGDGITDTPPDPFVSTDDVACGDLAALPLGGDLLQLPRANVMSYYDGQPKTLSAVQVWRVRQGALVRTGQDLRHLLPGTFLPPIEGESLTASATGGGYGPQTNMRAFLGLWSGSAQLWWSGADGATLTARFPVPHAGTYHVYVVLTEAPDFGIHRPAIDGQLAASVDLYGRRVAHRPVDLGRFQLPGGESALSLTNQGRNPASTGLGAGIDFLLLEPL